MFFKLSYLLGFFKIIGLSYHLSFLRVVPFFLILLGYFVLKKALSKPIPVSKSTSQYFPIPPSEYSRHFLYVITAPFILPDRLCFCYYVSLYLLRLLDKKKRHIPNISNVLFNFPKHSRYFPHLIAVFYFHLLCYQMQDAVHF